MVNVSLDAQLLILVSVAPQAPYPALFESGPGSTWARTVYPGVHIQTFSALAQTRVGRQLADVREMLRYPGARPDQVGSVDPSSSLVRAYGRVAENGTRDGAVGQTGLGQLKARAVYRGILGLGRLVSWWERHLVSPRKNSRPKRVSLRGGHLWVNRPTAMSNSMAIQMDMLKYLVAGPRFRGVLFVTSSAYVDVERFLNWVKFQGDGFVLAGSNALEKRGGMGRPFLSGFAQYMSWSAVQSIAEAKDLDHSTPNDVALTKWLLARGLSWVDPGIEWFTDGLDAGQCPLCEDSSISIVRCTSHGAREKEAEYMRLLDHCHVGDQI